MDPRKRVYGYEWPTLGLMFLVYAGWFAVTLWGGGLPSWAAVPVLAVILVLHSSLQHEVIHGHPFPDPRIGAALMMPGLGLVIPYGRFRDQHLAHHRDANLTDPYDDPESNYFDPDRFYRLPRSLRVLLVWNNTLLGRLAIGPAIGIGAFLWGEASALRRGERAVIRDWAIHAATLVPILWWLAAFGTLAAWEYAVAAYFALSILKIRTFVEHQAHLQASGRSVIIEDRGPLAFLFLNNNLHSVHHTHPQVAWYDLPKLYWPRREDYLGRNRGYRFPSYLTVARHFLFRPKDPVPHPLFKQAGEG